MTEETTAPETNSNPPAETTPAQPEVGGQIGGIATPPPAEPTGQDAPPAQSESQEPPKPE